MSECERLFFFFFSDILAFHVIFSDFSVLNSDNNVWMKEKGRMAQDVVVKSDYWMIFESE